MNPRTCIVTREEKETSEMIRFVADPQNNVVPDLQAKLPGRGVWVTADRTSVEKAVAKQAFSHGLKCKVEAAEDLPQKVHDLLHASAVQSLAIARKAGLVVSGFNKVDAEIRKGEIKLVCCASDAADDGVKKIKGAIFSIEEMGAEKVQVFRGLNSDNLSQILGRENVMHLAVKYGGATNSVVAKLQRYEGYLGKINQV